MDHKYGEELNQLSINYKYLVTDVCVEQRFRWYDNNINVKFMERTKKIPVNQEIKTVHT